MKIIDITLTVMVKDEVEIQEVIDCIEVNFDPISGRVIEIQGQENE